MTPTPTLREALESAAATLDGIVTANWRTWKELASADEFVRWAKARAIHESLKVRAALAAEPGFERRDDGEMVRVDRWEIGIRQIVALLWGNRHAFEVDEVVEAVRKLAPAPNEDDECLLRSVLAHPAAQQAPAVPLTHDQRAALMMVLCHYQGDPRVACLNDLFSARPHPTPAQERFGFDISGSKPDTLTPAP